MPYYVIKVTQEKGWLSPPIVANFPNEEDAIEAVKLMMDESHKVEAKGIRSDVMAAAFGDIAEGTAMFRTDWTWHGENGDTPEPK